MSLTVRRAAESLLRYLKPEQRSIPCAATEDDPLPDVLEAITGAMTEVFALGPLWQYRARRSARLYAPVTITIPSLTADSVTFTLDAPWQSWMLGCSIMIAGEPAWNEIIGHSGTTVTLLSPVITAGTNVSAQVFCDCVTVGTDVLQVLKPVKIADAHELTAVKNLSEIQSLQYEGFGNQDYGASGIIGRMRRTMGSRPAPCYYWHDTNYSGASTPAASRLRLAPMPMSDQLLHYRARLSTPAYALTDIYASGNPTADPGTIIPIRADLADTIFLPIAKQRFTGSPLFRNDNALPEIKRQYQAAYTIAKAMRPQADAGSYFQPGY